MDVCDSEQALRKSRTAPLVPARKNNAVIPGRSRTREVSSRYKSPLPSREVSSRYKSPILSREVSSRYKSPIPSTPSGARPFPSPISTRSSPSHSQSVQKRAISTERKRPITPPSPSSPSTPVSDSSVDMLVSRRLSTGRVQDSLWPSTMRSLSVSFQSDTISIPVSKKEKVGSNPSVDRTLRPSSNVAYKQAGMATMSRKPTPERKRSPLKGKNASDQTENAKPFDGLHSRLIDQHRWPSRIGGRVTSNSLGKSMDLTDKSSKALSTLVPGIGLSTQRMPNSVGVGKPLQKSSSDMARRLSLDGISRFGSNSSLADDNTMRIFGPHKVLSTSSSDKMTMAIPAARSHPLPFSGSRPASPVNNLLSSSSRGISPSRRPLTPPSRGVSPSRIRASGTQPNSTTSVLSFIADVRKGKRSASYIDDAHHLRLMYNRLLQWRLANSRAGGVLYIQKVTAEEAVYNVWKATLSLWDSVIRKRINLQQLKLELKLNSVLNNQMTDLNEWALLERDHISSLVGAAEDLEASTLRLPVTGGARVDIESLKIAISSAVDVMQAMGLSICTLLSRVEGMNSLVSELAFVAAEEKTMLDECQVLLASAGAMQVEEYSLRSHIIQ